MHTQHMKNICAHSRTSERSCGCADALVCRVRRSPRVQGAQSAQVPHVLGEDVTSAACGELPSLMGRGWGRGFCMRPYI